MEEHAPKLSTVPVFDDMKTDKGLGSGSTAYSSRGTEHHVG